jgi:hypothetical protein
MNYTSLNINVSAKYLIVDNGLWLRVKLLRACLRDFQALLGYYFLNPKLKSYIRIAY